MPNFLYLLVSAQWAVLGSLEVLLSYFHPGLLKTTESEISRFPLPIVICTVFAISLGVLLYDLALYNSSSTDELIYDEADPDLEEEQWLVNLRAQASAEKATRKALEAANAKIEWFSAAHDTYKEQLKQRAAEIRENKRIMQNQAHEVASSDHRADAAERSLLARNEYVQAIIRTSDLKDFKIMDQDAAITLQAQQIRDSSFDLEAMAREIEGKDQQLWEAAGRNTRADQEIAKLKAAVANEYTTLDYCCALDTIDRRDETINALEKQLVQEAKDHEFNQESTDTLAKLLVTLGGKTPIQAIRELEAWAEDRAARLEDHVTHMGPVVTAQQDECERLRNTIDLQHTLLRNAVETRDRQRNTLAEVKTQLAAVTARENANVMTYDQVTGEKQHLLDALNNSQQSLQALEIELGTVRTQLSHQLLQQAIDEKKVKFASNTTADQAAKLAAVTEQLATMDKQIEAEANARVQEVCVLNNKLCMIREALELQGIECDLWNVERAKELASMLEQASSEQEAKLAETCAELSAANEELKSDLSVEKAAVADLRAANEDLNNALIFENHKVATLTSTKDKLQTNLNTHKAVVEELSDKTEADRKQSRKEFLQWRDILAKTNTELAIAKRDGNSRQLEYKIDKLKTRLQEAYEENKTFFQAKLAADSQIEMLQLTVADYSARLRSANQCLDRAVKLNNEMRKDMEVQVKQIKDFTARIEKLENASCEKQEETRRLKALLEWREKRVIALEEVKEKLEKKLVLGDEFVEVTEEDVPGTVESVYEDHEVVVVQDADGNDSSDEFEAVDVDEDGEGLETANGASEIRVQ